MPNDSTVFRRTVLHSKTGPQTNAKGPPEAKRFSEAPGCEKDDDAAITENRTFLDFFSKFSDNKTTGELLVNIKSLNKSSHCKIQERQCTEALRSALGAMYMSRTSYHQVDYICDSNKINYIKSHIFNTLVDIIPRNLGIRSQSFEDSRLGSEIAYALKKNTNTEELRYRRSRSEISSYTRVRAKANNGPNAILPGFEANISLKSYLNELSTIEKLEAKAIIRNKKKKNKESWSCDPALEDLAFDVAKSYRDAMQEINKRYFKLIFLRSNRYYRQWFKAAEICNELGMSACQYIRSQFWWFNKKFRKPPEPRQLASRDSQFNSIVRAKLYKQVLDLGQKNPENTVKNITKVKSSLSQVQYEQRFEITLKEITNNFEISIVEALEHFGREPMASYMFCSDGGRAGQIWLAKKFSEYGMF